MSMVEPTNTASEPEGLSPAEAKALLDGAKENLSEIMERARRVRAEHRPRREVALCGILLGKCGRCPEDCAFCAQSSHATAFCPSRPLPGVAEMVERARKVASMGARAFSIVNAGRRPSRRELDIVCRTVTEVREKVGLECCASLGRVTGSQLAQLARAGLTRYHHNLEAARSFFPAVITTYAYEESVETIELAHQVGLEVCSAGVFGMGESNAQRVELISALRDLEVESVPICFLEPHPGTPLEHRKPLAADEALAIIAIHRLMLPGSDIIVTGGRHLVLGKMPGKVLDAGADGFMVGDYPTGFDDELQGDLRALAERGLSPRKPVLDR